MGATSQQRSLFEDYDGFVEKFKPKKTTDDCYTPQKVYDAVAEYVAERYGLNRGSFIRPFWPGADYRETEYPDGCVVVDNPPFSILSAVVDYYLAEKVSFFLFCPALTGGSLMRRGERVTVIATGSDIIYENGASVNTSFTTNMEPGTVIRSAPDLYRAVEQAVLETRREKVKELPKYIYPDNVLTLSVVNNYSKRGIDFSVPSSACCFIGTLDSQRPMNKSIFGGGVLLSDRAAADRAAADRAAALRWDLSEREKRVVKLLNKNDP